MSGEITGGDCYELWLVGVDHVPRIADIYYGYSEALGGISGKDKSLFDEPHALASEYEEGYAGDKEGDHVAITEVGMTTSEVYDAYMAVRDNLQHVFATTGDTLDSLGKVIQFAAWGYAESDAANANALDVFKDKIKTEEPAIYPPGTDSSDYQGKPKDLDDVPETEYENEPDYPPEEKKDEGSGGYVHG